MGRLVVSTFLTADGVMQAPGGPSEDREGGFEWGGWQAASFDAAAGERIGKGIAAMDALLLGRRTYDIFAAYWPKAPKDDPIAARLNSVPKYVASRTLQRLDWNNARLIQGDVAREVPHIKEKHGEVQVIGSGNLAQTLLKHRLVDRLDLWVHPVLLGTGKRLFAGGTVPTALKLVESQAFGKGVVLLSYEPQGAPTTGFMDAGLAKEVFGP